MGKTRGWGQGRDPEIKQEWQAGKGVVESGRKSAQGSGRSNGSCFSVVNQQGPGERHSKPLSEASQWVPQKPKMEWGSSSRKSLTVFPQLTQVTHWYFLFQA